MKRVRKSKQKLGDVGLTLRSGTAQGAPSSGAGAMHKRQLVADFFRLVGSNHRSERKTKTSTRGASDGHLPNLSPRMQQTLERLLAGDSEKQIAHHLGLSKHTVHVYVKALYKSFSVNSRGELLARFIRPQNLKRN